MMLPAVPRAVGRGCSAVSVVCLFSASTMLGVCLGQETQVEVIGNIITLSEYHTQLAKMSFDEIFDLTAGVYFHFL